MCSSSRTTSIQGGVTNLCLSPAKGPRSLVLAPKYYRNPSYRDKSGTLKPLKSPANTPNPPGRGLRGFTGA